MNDIYRTYAAAIAGKRTKHVIKEDADIELTDNLKVTSDTPINTENGEKSEFSSLKEFIEAVQYNAFEIGYGDLDDLYWEVGAGADMSADPDFTGDYYSYETILDYFNTILGDEPGASETAYVHESGDNGAGIQFTVTKA